MRYLLHHTYHIFGRSGGGAPFLPFKENIIYNIGLLYWIWILKSQKLLLSRNISGSNLVSKQYVLVFYSKISKLMSFEKSDNFALLNPLN